VLSVILLLIFCMTSRVVMFLLIYVGYLMVFTNVLEM